MDIIVNGQSEAGDYDSVLELLRQRDLDPNTVVVELNGKILPVENYGDTKLTSGDSLEIVAFVAGG